MLLSDVTPLILTFNEEANIERTLNSLAWAHRVVIVDSGSTDNTLQRIKKFPNVEVITREFDNHTSQWNFGLDQAKTTWVLTLDADYICSESIHTEIESLPSVDVSYSASFVYCIFGRKLRASLYPTRVVLFKPSLNRYVQDGHTQLLETDTTIQKLHTKILHDDWKPLSHWFRSQSRYAALEVDKLSGTPNIDLGWKDRIRKRIVLAPVLTLFYCLFYKRLILDGWPGWFYTFQRVYAELTLSLLLLERKLKNRDQGPGDR